MGAKGTTEDYLGDMANQPTQKRNMQQNELTGNVI